MNSSSYRRLRAGLLQLLLIASGFGIFGTLAYAQREQQLNLMPWPSHLRLGAGQLTLDQSFSVTLAGYKDDRLEHGVQRLLWNLSQRTGMTFPPHGAASTHPTLLVTTGHASNPVQEPGEDESYSLEITADGAKISAPTPLGTLHGLQTFLQLVEATPTGFAVPVISVQDSPRFVWRGLLIDVGRHFIPIDVLKRNLDGMAAVKLNVLHLHLSDYQGFRVESKKFPRLHELGSDGLYYTQAEIRDLIAYARDRGVRILPEFDMPGHSTSWFVGYPQLASAPGPYAIERNWGVLDPAMDPTRESTYKFLDKFIGEMAKLFPDPFFHMGGDEVNGKQWAQNQQIQGFMRSHGLKKNEELQAYFTQRVQKIVSKHGKTMVGWDEILSPSISKDIVIHSWRGPESLVAAARQGYRGLLSNGYYIDLVQPAGQHYAVDPLAGEAANLSADEKQRILGGEATMWTEQVTAETMDSRIWPRTAAIAERFWSPQSVTDTNSMYRRLSEVSWRLDLLGLTHNSGYVPMLQRIANTADIEPLRVLADVVEPVKEYARYDFAKVPFTSATPMNHLVDAARPESETARTFAVEVAAFVAGECKDAGMAASIGKALTVWRENDAHLRPLIDNSFLLKEDEAISRNLSLVAAAGLQAIDYIQQGSAPRGWKEQQLAFLEGPKKPDSAQLLLMPVLPVQKLIEATAAGSACQPAK